MVPATRILLPTDAKEINNYKRVFRAKYTLNRLIEQNNWKTFQTKILVFLVLCSLKMHFLRNSLPVCCSECRVADGFVDVVFCVLKRIFYGWDFCSYNYIRILLRLCQGVSYSEAVKFSWREQKNAAHSWKITISSICRILFTHFNPFFYFRTNIGTKPRKLIKIMIVYPLDYAQTVQNKRQTKRSKGLSNCCCFSPRCFVIFSISLSTILPNKL